MVLSLGKPNPLENERFGIFCNIALGRDVQKLKKITFLVALLVSGFIGLLLISTIDIVTAIFAIPMTLVAANGLIWVFIRSEFRKQSRREDSLAYLALNEFVAVLRATKSLKDAVRLVARGEFDRISVLFAQSLQKANLGAPLISSLATSFEKGFFGAARQYFLRAFALWDLSPNLVDHLAKNLAFSIQTLYREETERIRETSSAYIGLGSLAPPLVCAVLLISGNLEWFTVFCLA